MLCILLAVARLVVLSQSLLALLLPYCKSPSLTCVRVAKASATCAKFFRSLPKHEHLYAALLHLSMLADAQSQRTRRTSLGMARQCGQTLRAQRRSLSQMACFPLQFARSPTCAEASPLGRSSKSKTRSDAAQLGQGPPEKPRPCQSS